MIPNVTLVRMFLIRQCEEEEVGTYYLLSKLVMSSPLYQTIYKKPPQLFIKCEFIIRKKRNSNHFFYLLICTMYN